MVLPARPLEGMDLEFRVDHLLSGTGEVGGGTGMGRDDQWVGRGGQGQEGS